MLSARPSASDKRFGSPVRVIMQGAVRHLPFGLLASADVAGDDGRTGELAVGFANRRNAQQCTGTWLPSWRRKSASSSREDVSLLDLRENL